MNYELDNGVAVLHFDDGKVNAVGHDFVDALNEGLDRAGTEAKAVVIRGREGVFSAGFDLKEFQKGREATMALARRGFEMFLRLLAHPQPTVAACTGHAVAAGVFTLLSVDNRIGVAGDFTLSMPETEIGMDLNPFLLELVANRVPANHLIRAFVQATRYGPEAAVDVGLLDEIVTVDELDARVMDTARRLAALPAEYYAKNKQVALRAQLDRLRSFLEA